MQMQLLLMHSPLNATITYEHNLMGTLDGKAWAQQGISTHLCTPCHTGVGIGLPILATHRIILLCANATVVDAITLGCHLDLRTTRSMDALVRKTLSQ